MLGSVMVSARLNDGTEMNIRHIVIEGSSQWLISRKVTTKFDIIHMNVNYLKLPNRKVVSLENVGMHP